MLCKNVCMILSLHKLMQIANEEELVDYNDFFFNLSD